MTCFDFGELHRAAIGRWEVLSRGKHPELPTCFRLLSKINSRNDWSFYQCLGFSAENSEHCYLIMLSSNAD